MCHRLQISAEQTQSLQDASLAEITHPQCRKFHDIFQRKTFR